MSTTHIVPVPRSGRNTALLVGIGVVIVVLLLAAAGVSQYNRLVRLDQAVDAQWGQVENVYQRRSDLIPNLVATVKGAAAFERDTFTAVAEARARAGQAGADAAGRASDDPEALRRFQAAQDQLSSALGRLLVVVERYPDLHATQGFRDLQVQLEGTENRIAVERMRFNEVSREFNTVRTSFPTALIAGFFGGRFREKAYFRAQAGASEVPRVTF